MGVGLLFAIWSGFVCSLYTFVRLVLAVMLVVSYLWLIVLVLLVFNCLCIGWCLA